VVAPPGKVVDAAYAQRIGSALTTAPDVPQARAPAHRQHEAAREALPWPAAQSEREMMDDTIEPSPAPGEGRQHIGSEALGEDLALAANRVASEAADAHLQLDAAPAQGQVGCPPDGAALDPP
jgi:hypothetical protein